MGVVYLAEDIKLNRKVAIKQLRSDMTGNSAEARFRSEAQLLARLNHPNIVRLYDVIEKEHSIALVMELVEGVTLKEWMREQSPTLAEKLDLLTQICQGLGKAHCLGIIHRDLKPENILVTVDGIAKITDFGIAKALDCDQQLTREDHIAGSVQSMSPEQLQGGKLDSRSDLFSLGGIAYELLCESKPFEREDMGALAFAQQITNKPHIPPQQAWPDIPKPLIALLDRLLAKQPEQRPDSAQQVFEALDLLRKHGIDADTQQYSETVTQLLVKPRKKRNQTVLALTAAVLCCAVAFWGWNVFTQLPPQYIAILPVELKGTVKGEQNAEMLVETMVRQALMSAPGQLKSSALVSYSPKEGANFEDHLKELQESGVTDALLARLRCLQLRCNIELQRINPKDSQVRQQANFVFLSDKRQEAQYTISNSTLELFPSNYRKVSSNEIRMDASDYNRYLAILSIPASDKAIKLEDLENLETLIDKYPRNTNLYSSYAYATAILHSTTNDERLISRSLGILASAEGFGADKTAILEAQLQIKSLGSDREGFLTVLKKLQTKGHPSAHHLAQFSRFQYINGSYKESLKHAKEAAALSPSFNNYYYIAINQLALGNYPEVRSTLDLMIDSYPENNWRSYFLLGTMELEIGNLEQAEAALGSIPEEMRDWRAKSNLATIFFLQKKYQKALNLYLELLKNSPGNHRAVSNIAVTYLSLGNKEKAHEYFMQALSITEGLTSLKARQTRAESLAYTGQIAKAIFLITELLRDSPEDTYVRYTAAQVYALASEWQSASYYTELLIDQGMSTEWFQMPAFNLLCTHSQTSQKILSTVCLTPLEQG
ncbi:protein kinase domain-containing protein [Microbulbifer sp. TRSA002]|uniref:protein kinase domain-containing protein n=1 Tax=Microbulbifer sp. TRSA002 TaxID=3243382 RepID=UPI00403A51C0